MTEVVGEAEVGAEVEESTTVGVAGTGMRISVAAVGVQVGATVGSTVEATVEVTIEPTVDEGVPAAGVEVGVAAIREGGRLTGEHGPHGPLGMGTTADEKVLVDVSSESGREREPALPVGGGRRQVRTDDLGAP